MQKVTIIVQKVINIVQKVINTVQNVTNIVQLHLLLPAFKPVILITCRPGWGCKGRAGTGKKTT